MSGVLIPDGGFWLPNAAAVCERYGLVCLNVYEGHVYAMDCLGVEVPLAEILAKEALPEIETSGDGKVTQLKPAPRRT